MLYSVAAHSGIFGKHLPPPDDFPGVGVIEPPDIGSKLDEVMTAARDNTNAEAAPLYEEYISWLNAAKASERSLATFMY